MLHVWEFMVEFCEALKKQLEQDEERWGNTWLKRKIDGQEERTIAKFNDYFDQFRERDMPIPWLKIAGGAMICWLREKHPELWQDRNEQ